MDLIFFSIQGWINIVLNLLTLEKMFQGSLKKIQNFPQKTEPCAVCEVV
jgi:hypothetical protein